MARWEPDAEGRLTQAALALFDKQGYDQTTIAEIAQTAGLTKRSFFRYFADKREVLFNGSHVLQDTWVTAIRASPREAGPMTATAAGFDAIARLFADRHAFARTRARVIAANPELQERELIKLQRLAGAIAAALAERGVADNAATLAAQAGVTVFHVAFAQWVDQDDPTAMRGLIDQALAELRAVTSG